MYYSRKRGVPRTSKSAATNKMALSLTFSDV